MTWADFYLVCFVVGFALTLLSFVLGSVDFHLPGNVHIAGGHVHVGTGGAHPASVHTNNVQGEMSWLNFGTMMAFLAWFGGGGYMLTAYSGLTRWAVVFMALAFGIAGGSIVFFFIAKVLMKHDRALDPRDYEMVGVLGTVTVPIRAGGTGEIVFSQQGVRCCAGARSEDGTVIEKQTEVMVTRYEKGIAYVRRWDEQLNGLSDERAIENKAGEPAK
jgi:membrane protein implicated in regulation of membrane protease activity